jgi:hypothetical protein
MGDELRDEYQFDYSQAEPNRFASRLKKGGRLVVLDPEVAAAFSGSESVNAVLKALIQTMPHQPHEKVQTP